MTRDAASPTGGQSGFVEGDILVRPVRPEEYAEAGRVTADAYREFVRPTDRDEWPDYLQALADVAGRALRAHVAVALLDGRIAGCVTLVEDGSLGDEEAPEPDAMHVRMLGVDPSMRGRGVGRTLMRYAILRAASIGRRAVTLHTTDRMLVAQRMYGSLGFVREPAKDLVFEDFRLIAFRLPIERGAGQSRPVPGDERGPRGAGPEPA
jgi:ribosomal protein S18 acetylase RimI-like enzyme